MDTIRSDAKSVLVVLFDGDCNLCDGLVGFLARRDRAGRLRFVPIQSDEGRARLAARGLLGILVALNTQTAFNTPPVAMAAFYLKGVAPPEVELSHIFRGALPFVGMVFITMFLVYVFPGIALWLPDYLYTAR